MTKRRSRIAILGTGNIGTDLLIKTMRSSVLDCSLFAGRNLRSEGRQKANQIGARLSDCGISGIIQFAEEIDIIFDATSAAAHLEHWPALQKLGKPVINMTPAKIGSFCVPVINMEQILDGSEMNVNMITCGGQASLPIAHAIANVHNDIEYIEVASSIASRSAGPATRANLDEYVDTTEQALTKFSGARNAKAILILNPARPPIDMQTTIYAKITNPDIKAIRTSVEDMIKRVNRYVPGYQLIVPATLIGNKMMTTVKVVGNGDYLPRYAGNLDIINCAAICVAERLGQLQRG